jgi:hypothetical protein
MLRYEFQSFACPLYAPNISERSVETEINVRTSFENELSANQVFELIDEEEYLRRSVSSSYGIAPRSYAYRDKNVLLEIEFSEQPPLVVRPEKKYFVYFKITNVGNGFINPIKPGSFSIVPIGGKQILDCPVLRQQVVLYPNGNAFPRIACEVVLPPLIASSVSADFVVTLNYNYEVRNKIRINIIR